MCATRVVVDYSFSSGLIALTSLECKQLVCHFQYHSESVLHQQRHCIWMRQQVCLLLWVNKSDFKYGVAGTLANLYISANI